MVGKTLMSSFIGYASVRARTVQGKLLPAIPQLIDIETPSEAAICLHEAGHATFALMVGVAPTLVELTDDASLPGPARNRIFVRSQAQREPIACGAFVVEYQLFLASRLTTAKGALIAEKRFLQIALGSIAHADKVRYFGANHEQANGQWPRPYDLTFMNHAIALSPLLVMPLVTEFAEALLVERRLDCPRIIGIGAKHLPSVATAWTCPDDAQGHS